MNKQQETAIHHARVHDEYRYFAAYLSCLHTMNKQQETAIHRARVHDE